HRQADRRRQPSAALELGQSTPRYRVDRERAKGRSALAQLQVRHWRRQSHRERQETESHQYDETHRIPRRWISQSTLSATPITFPGPIAPSRWLKPATRIRTTTAVAG